MNFNEVLLYSGGLDSFIAYHFLEKKPVTLYFPLGHQYQKMEIEAIENTIPNTFVSSPFNLGPWEHVDAHIPMRNLFLVMGSVLHGARKIHLVVQKGEMSIPDRTPMFFNNSARLLSHLEQKEIEISSPFFHMTKVDMVEWYLNAGYDPSLLLKTRSCFSPTEKPCGRCGACFRRWVALEYNNLHEEMNSDILQWEGTASYIEKMKRGEYDEQRTRETAVVLKMHGIDIGVVCDAPKRN